jgi:hypothetical protein
VANSGAGAGTSSTALESVAMRARCFAPAFAGGAVGIRIAPYPPHRSVQADFPHTALASGGDAHRARRIGMVDVGRRQPAGDQPFHSFPVNGSVLASSLKNTMPVRAHGKTKVGQCITITWLLPPFFSFLFSDSGAPQEGRRLVKGARWLRVHRSEAETLDLPPALRTLPARKKGNVEGSGVAFAVGVGAVYRRVPSRGGVSNMLPTPKAAICRRA